MYFSVLLFNFIFAGHLVKIRDSILRDIELYKQQIQSLNRDKQEILHNLSHADTSKRSNVNDISLKDHCITSVKSYLEASKNELAEIEQKISEHERTKK